MVAVAEVAAAWYCLWCWWWLLLVLLLGCCCSLLRLVLAFTFFFWDILCFFVYDVAWVRPFGIRHLVAEGVHIRATWAALGLYKNFEV